MRLPEVGAGPGDGAVGGVIHEAHVERGEDGARAEREVEVPERTDAVDGVGEEECRGFIDDFISGLGDDDGAGEVRCAR